MIKTKELRKRKFKFSFHTGALLLVLLILFLQPAAAQTSDASPITDLFSINQLKRDFAAHEGKVRIVTLLSPT